MNAARAKPTPCPGLVGEQRDPAAMNAAPRIYVHHAPVVAERRKVSWRVTKRTIPDDGGEATEESEQPH